MDAGLGLLTTAEDRGGAVVVAMGGVNLVAFPGIVGTRGLGGCSVVVIASPHGAIMAHIPPNVPHSSELQSGPRLVQQKMDAVSQIYQQQKHIFSAGTETVVVCATYKGAIATPDLKRVIEANVEAMGLGSFSVAVYRVDTLSTYDPRGSKGTVFVDGRGQRPLIYVEDELINSSNSSTLSQQQIAPRQQTQATSESGGWVWDQRHQRYRRLVQGKWEWQEEASSSTSN